MRLLPLLLLAACAHAPAPKDPLWDLVEDYFDRRLALNPIEATYIGDHRFDDRLGNPASLEHLEATRALHRSALERAKAIDANALDAERRLILEIFIAERERDVAAERFPRHLLPMNQMGSMATTLAELGSGEGAQPLGTKEEHARWLRRAAEFPAWVDAAIARMREGLEVGVTPPKVAMAKTVAQLDGIIADRVEDSIFWAPAKGDAAREAEYRALIEGALMPAYRKLRAFLAETYVPGCRESVGWSALPDGEAWYAYEIRVNTTTSLGADEIFGLGQVEVARIVDEMNGVKGAVGFAGELPAFFDHLRTDPKFFFPSPEAVLAAYVEVRKKIDAALPKLFSDFPKADYEVRAIEAFRAEAAPGAEYRAPSEDGSRPGIFYVNTFNLKAQPSYGVETLSLHEAAPGHHFQIALQQELAHLPRFRRFADYNAYAEGWALYAESLGKELGLFTDPLQYYGRLNDEQLRAMRLVVDTGLHAKGWTRAQAIDFMLQHSSLARSDVEAEVDRYMVWPGQALGYKIGQFRIRAMREAAEQRLGAAFDVRAFHSAVLRDGAMPLEVLERKLAR